jgi:acetyltransferase
MSDALQAAARERPFGDLTPLLAARSVAVIGASDREGNLGGLAARFLQKFGYRGPIWPVNPSRNVVAELPCFSSLSALPSTPDMAIIAVPASDVIKVAQDCIDAAVPSAVIWAGGFAEGGTEGRALQDELARVCRAGGLKLCGPNCIGIINTSIGLTASFSSLMTEIESFTPGTVSIVSQSGGIAVNAHARAQHLGLGFRLTISCGNEAVLGIPDFMQALIDDDGTRVIAVYTEGISDPQGFVRALACAREKQKPVVILKGGATPESSRAALAHTGRLAGSDRTYDAIFREFAAVRVYSPEELLEAALQFASLRPGQLPQGNRVLVSSFGGGSGVIAADQCAREGLVVPPLDQPTRAQLKPVLTGLASSMNPVDLTPGTITNPKNRENFPKVLEILSQSSGTDQYLFFSSGFGQQAGAVAEMFETMRERSPKPVGLSWQAPPDGILQRLAGRGVMPFTEHARLIRAAGHVARYAADLKHRIRTLPNAPSFPWKDHISFEHGVATEDVVAGILQHAGLAVARGGIAKTAAEAVRIAETVTYKVAMKAISPDITHRAAAGLVALNLENAETVSRSFETFAARVAERGARFDGVWVQHMFEGQLEMLVTAIRDAEFGVLVGVGMGGAMTEVIDDVVFARAPIDADGAEDLVKRLRTFRRMPQLFSQQQLRSIADFTASFSTLVASAPWPSFTLEINPLKVSDQAAAAVDGLLVVA